MYYNCFVSSLYINQFFRKPSFAFLVLVCLQVLHVFAEQVSCPVDKIEEGEHEREEDARNNINPLGPCGELAEPAADPIFLLRCNVDLTGAHLIRVRVRTCAHQWFLCIKGKVKITTIQRVRKGPTIA